MRGNPSRFLEACRRSMAELPERKGVGTLGERTLHAVLKDYFEPNRENQEIKVGPYVADIYGSQGIIEIQTRDFNKLRKKLELFLQVAPVTVVYPVAARKWLIWLEEDGAASTRRKSPKNAGPWEVLRELYRIKPFLKAPALRFCVVGLELEEYRLKNGWGNGGKRGSTRFDRIPVSLLEEVWLECPEDYQRLIPKGLSEVFTAKEFSKAASLSSAGGTVAMNVLFETGAVCRVGKQGNSYLYKREEKSGEP